MSVQRSPPTTQHSSGAIAETRCNVNYELENAVLTNRVAALEKMVADLTSQLQTERTSIRKDVESEKKREVIEDDYFTDDEQLAADTAWIRVKNKKKNWGERTAKRARTEVSSSDSSTPAKEKVVEATNQSKTTTKKIPPPPPIMVSEVNNLNQLNAEFKKEKMTENISIKKLKDKCFKISTVNENEYRTATKVLEENKILWHTYENKQVRPIRVMVKNLDHSYERKEIKEDLISKGYKIIDVTNKISRKDNKPLDMFILSFEHSENMDNIFKIKKIMNSIVYIEAIRHSRLIPQCKRCQAYGHTQKYCHKEMRCVKCTDIHLTKDCDKSKDQAPKCVNCGNLHPANYRGCMVAMELQKIRASKEKKTTRPSSKVNKEKVTPRTTTIHRPVVPSITYANVVTPPSQPKMTQDSTNEILKTILRRLDSLDERLTRLENNGTGAIPKSTKHTK